MPVAEMVIGNCPLHARICDGRADCLADSPDHLRCSDISQWL
ncbi:hypothetical protein SY94_4060 [Agrobacterium tumefaciens]|nr:hypothetical protein SY94_4060 [Agrobacterium tumefaciens]